MNKNILLLIPYGGVGGIERLALTFYTRMKESGYNVKVVKIIKLDSDFILFGEDELYLSDKDFSEMSFFKRILFYLSIPFRYRQIIKKNRISHSIGFGDVCNLFSSLSFTNEKKIASIHSLKSVELMHRTIFNRIFEWAYRNTYKTFFKVVCISEGIRDDLLENCGYAFPENLYVIYNPHDVNNITKLAFVDIMTDNEKQMFREKEVVLFLGRYSRPKAPWHLVRSFSLVANRNPNAQLVFIGSGDQKIYSDLQRIVNRYNLKDRVSFIGQKRNPYPYLAAAKVLALSSYHEGTPNVIVESIALETPVVSTNCTKGIWELMCVDWKKDFKDTLDSALLVDSGYISPAMFKDSFSFDTESAIQDSEIQFAEAIMNSISMESKIVERVHKHKRKLLEKFEVDNAISQYLE